MIYEFINHIYHTLTSSYFQLISVRELFRQIMIDNVEINLCHKIGFDQKKMDLTHCSLSINDITPLKVSATVATSPSVRKSLETCNGFNVCPSIIGLNYYVYEFLLLGEAQQII